MLTNIPLTLIPGAAIEFDNRNAVRGLIGMPRSITLIGQVAAGAPIVRNELVSVTSDTQADTDCGRGSMLAAMAKAALRNNQRVPVQYIAVDDDPAALEAIWHLTFAVDAQELTAGTLTRYIAATPYSGRISIAVAADDDADTLAQRFADAVNANGDVPVTATTDLGNSPGACILTCRWHGESGNDIQIMSAVNGERDPAGVTTVVSEEQAGTLNPDIQDALAAVGDLHLTKIAMPYLDQVSLATLEADLDRRWSTESQKDGRAVISPTGDYADLVIFADANRNSHQVVGMGFDGSPTPSYVRAADLAAAIEPSAAVDPGVAFEGLVLRSTLAPKPAVRFNEDQREVLLGKGISTYRVDASGRVIVERLVTMYNMNSQGGADPSYQDLNTVEVLSYWRWHQLNQIALQLRGFKLAPDGTPISPRAGKVMTPQRMGSWLISHYQQFIDVGLMTNLDDYKATLVVLINESDPNRLDTHQEPNVINQLRFVATTAAFVR